MAKVKEKFVFIFLVFKYFNICVIVCPESDHLNKQVVKVIWQKAPHGGPIPRLGVTGHPRGSKVVPLNSWGRVSY